MIDRSNDAIKQHIRALLRSMITNVDHVPPEDAQPAVQAATSSPVQPKPSTQTSPVKRKHKRRVIQTTSSDEEGDSEDLA